MSKQIAVREVAPLSEAQIRWNAFRDEESKQVRGKFIYHEVPGGQLDFAFKKFKGGIETYHLKDGQVCTIPLAVARHLNDNVSYPSYNYKNDENGQPSVSIAERVRRASFHSLEFNVANPSYVNNGYVESALPK